MTDFMNRKSYQDLLRTGRALFWKFGVKRVSVEELCKAAGVSKMTFYRMFKNKTDLVIHILRQVHEKGIADYHDIMQADKPFPEKIRLMVLKKQEYADEITNEFFSEVYQSDDEQIQSVIQEYVTKQQAQVMRDFEQAQREGWIRQDMRLDVVFYLLNSIQAKLADPAFIDLHNHNIGEAIMSLTNFFFYGISNTPEE